VPRRGWRLLGLNNSFMGQKAQAEKRLPRNERTVKKMSTVELIGVALLVSVMANPVISEAQSSPDAKTLGPAAGPSISIDDIDRFYHLYDSASGHPNADELQHNYLDKGSEGLLQFAKLRHISGTTIAENLAKHPEMYSNARRCADVLPHVRQRLAVSLRKLGDLYPEAKFPPVTIAVGHGKPEASEARCQAFRLTSRPFAQ
jgi:hypothetical protein